MNTAFSDIQYGLIERDIQTLFAIFEKFQEVETVYLYGSRAKGTHKFGSDIDLALMNENISEKTVRTIKTEIEESSLPYFVDITHFTTLNHKELAEHIQRVGVPFYIHNYEEVVITNSEAR
jgi:predicted nucleotidyltransferase